MEWHKNHDSNNAWQCQNRKDCINVLYISSDVSLQSGAFKSLLFIKKNIVKYGFNPILVIHKDAKNYDELNLKKEKEVYFLELPKLSRRVIYNPFIYFYRFFNSVRKIKKIIRQKNINIIHINEIYDIYGGVASRIAKVPCVWHVRADPPKLIRWFLSRIIIIFSNKVLVVSKSVHNRNFIRVRKNKIFVINNPAPDLFEFNSEINGSLIRKEFGINKNDFVVTLVAKLSRRKGHEIFIKAIPKVLKLFPKTYFLLVGKELKGKRHTRYKAKLNILIKKLGIENKIILTGFRQDVPKIMAASDIIVHCSIYPDPFPGTVIQGMAMGKPVIASKIGGTMEQIDNNVSGILINPGNSDILADAICDLLNNKEKRQNLGKEAIKKVYSQFNSEKFFQKLCAIYFEVLKK